MFEIIILWFTLCFLSFGFLGFYFVLMRKQAMKPWRLRIDKNYKPKVSILVPTYNESEIISFKLENLNRIDYPRDLTQIIIVDSNSNDHTVDIVKDFVKQHPKNHIQILVEHQRRGKSAALNLALKHCNGEVIIVSDTDCFWPSDILHKTLPFLADPNVGAISGSKILLNPNQSWITKTEDAYLNFMNLTRLGESKVGSTIFFEGGFSAYKKEILDSFDPYNTGSDDCGTIVNLAEKNYRAIFIPEARFYSAFPTTWKEKVAIKIRRANQLVRVLWVYARLLSKGRIKGSKKVIIQGIFNYVLSPLIFIMLMITTIYLLLHFPYFTLVFLIFLVPRIGSYLFETIQNYLVLFLAIVSVAFNKKFIVWNKPEDRALVNEDVLGQYGLI